MILYCLQVAAVMILATVAVYSEQMAVAERQRDGVGRLGYGDGGLGYRGRTTHSVE